MDGLEPSDIKYLSKHSRMFSVSNTQAYSTYVFLLWFSLMRFNLRCQRTTDFIRFSVMCVPTSAVHLLFFRFDYLTTQGCRLLLLLLISVRILLSLIPRFRYITYVKAYNHFDCGTITNISIFVIPVGIGYKDEKYIYQKFT